MSSLNASVPQNTSVVRPDFFFIVGLSGIAYSSYYYIFLCITYFITVIGNSSVLLIIALHRSLHSPKYIGVFNLALADFGETNAVIPNMMKIFFFDSQYISYNACLANMFFVYLFFTVQSVTLVVLAYDRFIAICLPLRYHAIMNNTVMCLIFLLVWLVNACLIAVPVCLVTRLSFCKTNVIESYFCDHGPVYNLACNDNSMNVFMANLNTALYIVLPLLIIVLSYVGIFFTLLNITTWEKRLKALKTCVSHLLVVGTVFFPLICIFIITSTTSFYSSKRVITSLSYAIPPMLNPIIYVLNTAEIKDILRKICKNRCFSFRKIASK